MPHVSEMLGTKDPRVKQYAQRIFDAWERGSDVLIIEIQAELQSNQDLYWSVWGILPSTMRRQIKEIVEREKT